jgi:hypothetical protein
MEVVRNGLPGKSLDDLVSQHDEAARQGRTTAAQNGCAFWKERPEVVYALRQAVQQR